MASPAETAPPASGGEIWLESLIRPNLRPYSERAPLALESMARLLDCLDNPHRGLRAIHLAGSKGKGSTALMIEALLEAGGTRTGTYTSPHLERWTERFRVGGREIAAADLDQAVAALRPHVVALAAAHPDNPPSFFDTATTAALWLFRSRGVDAAIIETGIGGRFDATNAVDAEIACITGVELEHADKLGPDLGAIAAHKAGILKPGAAAVVGRLEPAAAEVIRAEAGAKGCEILWLGEDIHIERRPEEDAQAVDYRLGDISIAFRLGHPGPHMADNAALALTCAARFAGFDGPRLRSAARVLEDLPLPGRTEVLRRAPWWIVDAAHTGQSVAALAEALDALPAKDRHFVVSLSGDKPASLLAPLLARAASVTVTRPEPLRSVPSAKLAAEITNLYPALELHVDDDVPRAIGGAMAGLGPGSLLCATGSTYMAGAARRLLRERLNAGGTLRPAAGKKQKISDQ